MEFHLLHIILALLSITLVATHAALTPELYWKSKLPNTPMPNSILDLLHPDFKDEKGTVVVVGKGGVTVNTEKGNPGGTSVGVKKGGVNVSTGNGKPGGGGTNVNVGRKGGVGVSTGKPGRRTNVGVGKGGVSVSTGHKGKPVYVGVHPGPNPFLYKYAATETQLHDESNVAVFFLEKDMHTGETMKLHFVDDSNKATFLPRQLSKSIPFSSDAVPEILSRFSIEQGSTKAEMIKNTIKECEEAAVKGEEKYCATSLESMIDFTTSKIGKVKAISTEVEKETQMQKYRIAPGTKKMSDGKTVVCHKQNYAYAVFYCHTTQSITAYSLPLVGDDGTKVNAVAVCHTNTSEWNPKHLAFQVLKVKPGTVPICHFLPQDHIVWIPI